MEKFFGGELSGEYCPGWNLPKTRTKLLFVDSCKDLGVMIDIGLQFLVRDISVIGKTWCNN